MIFHVQSILLRMCVQALDTGVDREIDTAHFTLCKAMAIAAFLLFSKATII